MRIILLIGASSLAVAGAWVTRVRRQPHRRHSTLKMLLSHCSATSLQWTVDPNARAIGSDAAGKLLEAAAVADPEIRRFSENGGTFVAQPRVSTIPDGAFEMHGALVWAEGGGLLDSAPRPGIVLVHTAVGPQDMYMRWRALALASRGYIVLIADLLGDPHGDAWDPAWSVPRRKMYAGDGRSLLQQRTRHALTLLASESRVDASALALAGYCFGGRAVLDVLKASAQPPPGLRGVVSFHGIADGFVPPVDDASVESTSASAASVRLLICHADDDPFVPRADLDACLSVLTDRRCPWTLQSFGPATGAKHSFTNPAQTLNDNPSFGYDAHADRASWAATKAFLEDVLAPGHLSGEPGVHTSRITAVHV